jgi:two-component system cell cycle sensor histidine kinase/response regulator CckA
MRTGAQDYIMKDSTARLAPAVARELAESENRRQSRLALAAKEQELRHAQKLEAIGQLAGGLAHDFNNILGIIGLYAEKVRSQTNDDEVQKSLTGIFNAHQRGTKLIRQLLTIGKKQAFEAKIFDLSGAVQKIIEIMTVGLGREHELVLKIASEPLQILGDSVQIEQVLMNFIINSRDAMTEPGQVTIQTSLQSISGEKKVLLSFSDTGCGMSEATLKRTFEPFFTTKEVGKGSGMGLATVMAIIKQHDGEISVSSELNRGTQFNILFPYLEQIL